MKSRIFQGVRIFACVIKKLFPILSWLPNYSKKDFLADFPAGITVGIMLIPQGMAYALIAGLPMEYGLYASLVPQMIYAITGTSRQLSVGPVAMDSLLVAAGLSAIAVIGSERYIELAIGLALLMGAIQLLLGFLRAGFLVNFLSRPIISGFTSAAALIIGANQIANLFGIDIPRNNQIHKFIFSVSETFTEIHISTLLIGIVAIILLVVISKYRNIIKVPAALIVVITGILFVWGTDLANEGVKVVGNIPTGLPSFSTPSIGYSDIRQLLPIAITLALIAFMEAYSVAKAIEEKHDYKIDANQELRAIGLSNIFGALFQSYPTTGGFSRSAVNDNAGAVTPMSSLIAAVLIGLTLLFLTPLFYYLPKAVLSAIVMVAVIDLIDFKLPIMLWKSHKVEAVLLFATFLVTATVGMTQGIAIGVGLSLVVLVYRQMRPHFTELGEIEGVFRNVHRFPKAKVRDGLLIVRFDSALHFANYRFLQSSLEDVIEERTNRGDTINTIILCAESIGYIDASGISALESLIDDLENRNICFRLAAAIGPVRDVIESSDLIKRIGKTRCFTGIHYAISDLEAPGSIHDGLRKVATQVDLEDE
ncbi:MAG: sodium-independent anion transporter [Bacteroidetes bacterium]|nr:MAG: sodium-independent anion transporter [Bacteroidota bacterium]